MRPCLFFSHASPVIPSSSSYHVLPTVILSQYDPLIPPALLCHELPTPAASEKTISASRHIASKIIHGQDPRVLVICGPCSIHDPEQAIEYAKRLQAEVEKGRWKNLYIIMRVYFEKPRTTIGWKGLIK